MFISRDISASTPAGDNDYWYFPIGISTSSGSRVSPENAMRLTAVYACVKVLAETVAQLPLILYQRSEDRKSRAKDHPLHRILSIAPNRFQTSFEWREMMQGHVTLRGNAYSKKIFSPNGEVSELIPLHPDRVRVEAINDDFTNYRYVYRDLNHNETTILRSEMFHIRGMSSDGVTGISPIQAEAEAIGVGLAAQDFAARFFSNDGTPGGWIEHPGNFKTPDSRREFVESWRQQQSGSNRHKTAVLEYGMKYHQMSINNKDLQFLESRKYQDIDIARIFRVPPHKIGNLDRATFSNIEHQALEFVTDTMLPWFRRWEQAISRDLILDEDSYYAEFLVDSLMRGDTQSRYNAYSVAINAGFMTRNEAREKENLDKLDGLDDPLSPLNMTAGDAEDSKNHEDESESLEEVRKEAALNIVNKELKAMRRAHKCCIEKKVKSKQEIIDIFNIDGFFSEKHVDLISKRLAINRGAVKFFIDDTKEQVKSAILSEIEKNDPAVERLLIDWEIKRADQMVALGGIDV